MAEFAGPSDLVAAAKAAHEAGYRRLDAYSPFPIEEVSDAIGFRHTAMPLIVLFGGAASGVLGFLMQYFIAVDSYPLNVGGRPLNSWPSFIVVTFELTILGGALAGAFGLLAANGLPKPYHPVFNVKEFARASQDAFFLCIEARDPQFDAERTRDFLQALKPITIAEVPH
jgi:hypothetical protein